MRRRIRKFAQNTQTSKQVNKEINTQTNRGFKNRGHLIPCGLWIVGERVPTFKYTVLLR